MNVNELLRNATKRTAFHIPERSIAMSFKAQRNATPKPHQQVIVLNAKAGQAQRDKSARISRTTI